MNAAPGLIFVHSPLVGPLTWRFVADHMRALGHVSLVPSLAGLLDDAPPYYPRIAHAVAEAARASPVSGPLVLVAHSGAGALLPAIGEAIGGQAVGAVFADAILPHPGASWFDSASREMAERIREMAQDGRLPPWNEWFPSEAIVAQLPDADLRARFIGELPRVPVAYLGERAPLLAGWPAARSGYLQLSAAYQDAAEEARRRGWVTHREAASHMAPLTRPDLVATQLGRVLAELADA